MKEVVGSVFIGFYVGAFIIALRRYRSARDNPTLSQVHREHVMGGTIGAMVTSWVSIFVTAVLIS